MRYLSVCSGIEAASVAWKPLGWAPTAFAEVDAFPSAVLAHHYPNVPNLGDLTKWKDWPDAAVDVLVGGTPCQSFSVAGLRKGLDDPRGGLLWSYLAVARRYRPRWVVWENVPGVLSIDDGRAFGSLLGGLAELGYGFAYRVLDAQYVRVDGYGRAVPQRRRRVFVVGYLGDARRAAAVLLERACLSGHPAPRREARQGVAADAGGSSQSGGFRTTDLDNSGAFVPVVANPLTARMYKGVNTTADEGQKMIAHALRAEGFDASEDGTGRGVPLVPVAFDARQSDVIQYGDLSGPLDTDGHTIGVMAFDASQIGNEHHRRVPADLAGALSGTAAREAVAFNLRGREGGAMPELSDVASLRAASGGSSRSYVAGMTVRRLTPRECERLQGFPDDYTLIPYRGKPAADGPRYKALGNSMAVNCMRWIGRRIAEVDALPVSEGE